MKDSKSPEELEQVRPTAAEPKTTSALMGAYFRTDQEHKVAQELG